MNRINAFLKFVLLAIGINILMGVITVTAYILTPYMGTELLFAHFFFGYAFFLNHNIPAISWNAATWGPGLGAFLIAVVVIHRYLSRWAERTGRHWSFATSFCLVMVVPVLFVISFIVPGVLLQWEALRETVWINVG